MQGDIERKSVLLKEKLKDNYFVSKHKRTVLPIPLIYGQVKNNQFQLWLERVFVFLASNDNASTMSIKRYLSRDYRHG